MQCCGVQFLKINMIQNIMLQFNSFTAQNDKFLCLEPEPESARTLGFRSRYRSRQKKVAAPQHWKNVSTHSKQRCAYTWTADHSATSCRWWWWSIARLQHVGTCWRCITRMPRCGVEFQSAIVVLVSTRQVNIWGAQKLLRGQGLQMIWGAWPRRSVRFR